jgi:hypothetical protein
MNDETIAKYVSAEEPLPATFTTGYRSDLKIARRMVQKRRGDEAAAPLAEAPPDDETAPPNPHLNVATAET